MREDSKVSCPGRSGRGDDIPGDGGRNKFENENECTRPAAAEARLRVALPIPDLRRQNAQPRFSLCDIKGASAGGGVGDLIRQGPDGRGGVVTVLQTVNGRSVGGAVRVETNPLAEIYTLLSEN